MEPTRVLTVFQGDVVPQLPLPQLLEPSGSGLAQQAQQGQAAGTLLQALGLQERQAMAALLAGIDVSHMWVCAPWGGAVGARQKRGQRAPPPRSRPTCARALNRCLPLPWPPLQPHARAHPVCARIRHTGARPGGAQPAGAAVLAAG